MAGTIKGETKREGQKTHNSHEPKKKGRELISLVVGSYFTHYPSNVTYMQIVRSNTNGRSKTNIIYQRNLPFFSRC
jgi:hypothetical protein